MTEKSIARRKNHWEKCKYGVSCGSGALSDLPLLSTIHCCTNINIGQRWHLERWQEFIKKVEGSSVRHINLDKQAYSHFGTSYIYVLKPEANFIECEECPEYNP